METENSLVLREAAKDAQMAYFDHLAAGGKRDPDRESWIEALTDGADAITRASVIASRLTQVERERDAAVFDLAHSVDACCVCKLIGKECQEQNGLDGCCFQWRGVCGENTKENETLQEEEPR